METFHVVSECNTAVYFSWSLIQALAQPVQLFWPLVTFGVTSGNSLTDSELQLFIETEKDQTRYLFIQYWLYFGSWVRSTKLVWVSKYYFLSKQHLALVNRTYVTYLWKERYKQNDKHTFRYLCYKKSFNPSFCKSPPFTRLLWDRKTTESEQQIKANLLWHVASIFGTFFARN